MSARCLLQRPYMKATSLSKISDDELLQRLQHTCREADRLVAQLILQLIEVDERRLHLRAAFPSLFQFCRVHLRMSEGAAFRAINAARLVTRFPRLLRRIERGDVHLSALVQLRDHFTEENVDDLVDAAKGKNKADLGELVARMAPRPDVPSRLRKLPHHDRSSKVTPSRRPNLEALAEARWRLQLTASRALRDKLLRARDLMMHSNPSGDLAIVVERAVDELLEKLEKRFGRLPSHVDEAATSTAKGRAESAATSHEDGTTKSRLRGLARVGESTAPAGATTSAPATANGSGHFRQQKFRSEDSQRRRAQ